MSSSATPVQIARRGLMLVLSSPSGAGKTTISRELLKRDSALSLSISATTRPKRPAETDGDDYFFVGEDEFNRMIEAGEFLEHANIFGHFYGTPRGPVEEALAEGRDILFDIDWQGTQQIGGDPVLGNDLVSVFVLPPSTEELEARLRRRAQDPEEVVQQRMSKAADEMSHYFEYQYIIVNVDIDESVRAVQSIIDAERTKRMRLKGVADFVSKLRRED